MKSIYTRYRALLSFVFVSFSLPILAMDVSGPVNQPHSLVEQLPSKLPVPTSQPGYFGSMLNVVKTYPHTTQAVLLSLFAAHNLLSSEEHIALFSDGPVSTTCEIQIKNILYKHGVKDPASWQIYRMNNDAREKAYIPYALVTTSVIFIDDRGFELLQKNKATAPEFEALCVYIAQQATMFSYLTTETSTSLRHGATWCAVSGIVYGLTHALQTGLSGTQIDTTFQAMSSHAYLGWAVWAGSILLSSYVYSRVQSYVQPYIRKPFDMYTAHSLRMLDKQVAIRLGDNARGAADLLAIMRDSLEEDDPRYQLIRQRIEALRSYCAV